MSNMHNFSDDEEYRLAHCINNCMTDEAFENDNTLRTLIGMSEDSYIPLEFFRTKPSVAIFDASEEEMALAVAKYCTITLKLDESLTRITRVKPFNVDQTRNALTPWSIYVEGLKAPYDTADKIKELFEKVDPVHHVVLPEAWNGTNKFFGFCFVEFNVPQSVHRAVRLFNRFDPQASSQTKHKIKERTTDQDVSEIDWEKLKSKYLAQQKALEQQIKAVWEEMNGRPAPSRKPIVPQRPDHTTFIADIRGPRPPNPRTRKTAAPSQKQSSDQDLQQPDYDQGVVVHVDNIQPRTNKSILKKLLEKSGATTTFVNFKKDIPSCNVRLSTAEDAQKMTTYFTDHPTTQLQADDAQGTRDVINALAPLKVRILAGKEEEIYWQTQEKKKERFSQVRQTRKPNHTPLQDASSGAESSSTSTTPMKLDVAPNDGKKSKRSETPISIPQPAKKPKNTHVHF
ncbi:hypothetical protein BC943DRAFT_363999 [Umbelopsis sp. AD052]|nr:hypothetical protein BC943DRAFT_363999 [Umbelopsis sp. AD052]